MGEFCQIQQRDDGSATCGRCGSWSKHGAPTCPPYITRCEPDNQRLPHITTAAENQRAADEHLAACWAANAAAAAE